MFKLTVKDVPVEGFWSITVYTPQRQPYANALGRYAINTPMVPSLLRDADGRALGQLAQGKGGHIFKFTSNGIGHRRQLRQAIAIVASKQPIPVSEARQTDVLNFIAGRLKVVLMEEYKLPFDTVDAVLERPHLIHEREALAQRGSDLESSLAQRNAELSDTLARLQAQGLMPQLPAEVPDDGAVDLRTMYQIISESFRDHYDFQLRSFEDWVEAKHSDQLADPTHWYLAEIDGEAVGGLMGHNSYLEADNAGYVANLGVLRQGRGRGVAKALLRTSFTRYAADGRSAVKLHVDAKRYLCATRPAYREALSDDSKRSLELQGGVFSPEEAFAFEQRPGALDAVRLREWDDLAKTVGQITPPLAEFLELARQCARL